MAYRSQRQFADALGIAASTLAKYIKRGDWPRGVPVRAPWSADHLAAVQTWRGRLQGDRSGKGDPPPELSETAGSKEKVEVALKFHRMRKARVEADEAEAKKIDREVADVALTRLAAMFVNLLEDMQQALPHQLDGDAGRNEQILRQAFNRGRERIIAEGKVQLDAIDDEVRDRRAKKTKARGRKRA